MPRITQLVSGIRGNGLCSFHIIFQEFELYQQAKEPYPFSVSTLPLKMIGTILDREYVGHFLKYFRNPVSSHYGDQIFIHSTHIECLLFTGHHSWGTGTAVMNKHCLGPCTLFCPPLYVLIYSLRHQSHLLTLNLSMS